MSLTLRSSTHRTVGWLIGYLDAMGFGQLQSVGVAMGYHVGNLQTETHRSRNRIFHSYQNILWLQLIARSSCSYLGTVSISYRSRMSMKLFLAEGKFSNFSSTGPPLDAHKSYKASTA